MLELYELKGSRTVLRGESGRKAGDLPGPKTYFKNNKILNIKRNKTMARITVGNCLKCGRELRVKEGASSTQNEINL